MLSIKRVDVVVDIKALSTMKVEIYEHEQAG